MEAVPRLPMLSFQLKVSPETTSFGKLKQYIRDFYNEDPESYSNEIYQLEHLRGMAARPPIAVTGCSVLKKYYCQLHFVQSRFPMGSDEPAAVPFAWRDSYSNLPFNLSNIRFELSSILYNIGAIHSQLGSKTERTSAEGMKMACSHFQCAAWSFEHLQTAFPQLPGVDLHPDLIKFMHQLSLAQAQECILEKSMLDNRKPTIVAKVAKQIVDYYGLALRTLEPPNVEESPIGEIVGSKIYKSWKNYVKFKRSYHMAVTYLYQGLAAEEQQKMGERVAFYNAALASLNTSRGLHTSVKGSGGITGVPSEKDAIEDALVFTNDVIEGKRKAAKNENEFIYHEEVPEKDMLPTVNGASLVKGISFNVNDSEISGPDIFARLVPMQVHEASSLYSEEKAKILRSVGGKIEDRDQTLETYLSSLKLQHLTLWDPDIPIEDILTLPEELVERCAVLNAKPNAIKDLEDIMSKLSVTYGDVEAMLKDIDRLLKEEDLKERQYQETMGKRPPSIVATDLTREAKKYEEAHGKASESNQALHRAMALHLNNLQILSQPLSELAKHIPSMKQDKDVLSTSDANRQNVRELKRILGKVEEMQRQRSDLHAKLRESIAQDNLTRLLVTATADSLPLDALFSEQLEKHQSLVDLIDKNLSAQDNILTALTDAYARTSETRKSVEEILKRREIMISSLIASYDAYEDLMSKSSKGLEFYRKLEVNVTKLLQRVKSTCRVQEEEREQILARNGKARSYPGEDNVVSINVGEKKGSGMKLRDHLMTRMKNPGTNYYQYEGKQQIPVAPVPPNTHMSGAQVPTSGSDGKYQDTQGYQGYYYQNQGYYQVGQGSQMNQVGQAGQMNQAAQPGQMNQVSQASQMNQAGQMNQVGQTGQVNQVGQAGPMNQVGQTGQINQVGQPGQMNQIGQRSQMNQVAQVNQVNQPGQVNPPANPYSYSTGFDSGHGLPRSVTTNSDNMYHQAGTTPTEVASDSSLYAGYANFKAESDYQVPQGVQMPQVYPTVSPPQPVSNPNSSYPDYSGKAPQEYLNYYQAQVNVPVTSTIDQNPVGVNQSPVHLPNRPHGSGTPQGAPVIQAQVNPNMPDNRDGFAYPQVNSPSTFRTQAYSGVPAANTSISGHYGPNSGMTGAGLDQQQSQMEYYKQMMPVVTQQDSNYTNYGQAYNQVPAPTMPTYSKPDTIIQSHTKSTGAYLTNNQNYSNYTIQGHQNQVQVYPNYSQGYTWQGHTDSYQGHPGYSYDPTSGIYQYSSGYQQQNQAPETPPTVPDGSINPTNNSHYTSANNAAVTNLTPSPYSNGINYQSNGGQDYYQVQNIQVDNQVPHNCASNQITQNIAITNQGLQQVRPDQIYNQVAQPNVPNQAHVYPTSQISQNPANDNVHHGITINNQVPQNVVPDQVHQIVPQNPSSQISNKSNLDLLADLDITINHAPLVPEIPVSDIPSQIIEEVKSVDEDIPKEERPFQLDDKHENLKIVWDTWYNDVQPKRDPLGDPVVLQKFISDIEKYEKFVDSLTVKTLSGSTNLENKWREIREFEEKEGKKQTFSAAVRHSGENRSAELVPYDATRVSLGDSGEYINASHVKDLTQWTPMFILGQAPMSRETIQAFWDMIWEQGSEVIACLCGDQQLQPYWPSSDSDSSIGHLHLQLKSLTNHSSYVSRVITVVNSKERREKTVVHMQYTAWPIGGFPASPGAFLSFAIDIMSEQALRHCPKPIVVHCVNGGALSALFLLAAASICHVRAGCGIVDVPLVLCTLAKYRKCLVDRDTLLFGYRMVLYYAQDSLMKRGILSSTRSTFDGFDGLKGKGKTGKPCHPSDDFLHSLGIPRQQSNDTSNKSITSEADDKTDRVKPVDPLSQLDPLWSIRK